MPDFRTFFDSEYLYAFHLAGREVTVTIDRVTGGELTGTGGKKARKPVVFFRGKDKPMALNKTNGKTIAAMYGNDVSKWVGKQVTLYPTTTNFGNETVECIRIRPGIPRGNGKGAPPPPAPDPTPEPEEPYDGPPEDLREPGSDG